MPDNTPIAMIDLEDLAFHEGVPVLLRRALSAIAVGQLLEIRGSSADLDTHLLAWCRQSGNAYHALGNNSRGHLIERVVPDVPLLHPGSEVAEVADPAWGLAPRGASIEAGGPQFSFPLNKKREIWAEDTTTIHRQAVANQWSAARDIPWQEIPSLSPEVETSVCQIMTFLTENEFAALYIPSRFLARIHPHYREVVELLAMQIVDEARHVEVFTRRAEAKGVGLGTTAVSSQLSLQTLIEEPEFTTAEFLLSVMGEGTFLTLLQFMERYAPDPVTALIARMAHRDEARHVAFGVSHLRYLLEIEPQRRSILAAAVERRSQVLASVTGLSPYVNDALVIYSGGGGTPADIRRGTARVNDLHRDMDRGRSERLQALGFGINDSENLSSYHTKNFM